MSVLNIDALNVPAPIREKLRELSQSILIEKESDKGSNGWLFFGTNNLTKQKVALKFYNWAGDHSYHAEPANLALLKSENVTKVMNAAYVDGDYAFFETPFYIKGDLENELLKGRPSNLRAIGLARNVLSGLSYMHAKSLLHRDLKPENIFLSDDEFAIIGDFGSVKYIPDGEQTVPGSGHSLIYRPPESVNSGQYGKPGDLYQVGILLYQLLGGSLPYDETSWLTGSQLIRYNQFEDPIDQQLYATDIVCRRIKSGRIVDIKTMPVWVDDNLKRVISKACNSNPARRFQSSSEFLAQLGRIRTGINDWAIEDGYPTRHNGTHYRIITNANSGVASVQKRRNGPWRNDRTLSGENLVALVQEINQKCR